MHENVVAALQEITNSASNHTTKASFRPHPERNTTPLSTQRKTATFSSHHYQTPPSRQEEMATEAPDGGALIEEEATPEKATQLLLQKACKWLRISSNGTKGVLVARLKPFNVKTRKDVVDKANQFDQNGPIPAAESTVATSVRTRQAPWTPHEPARLVHVLADPRHFTSLRKLHVKPEMRAEYETDRDDPWSAQFRDAFIDFQYQPERPDPMDGVTQQMLAAFHPGQESNKRTADAMRKKWASLRARFTVAIRNYEKSGQGESDVFPDFASSDPITSYMFCVFRNLPSLDIIMREVGDSNWAECGVGDSEVSDRTAEKYTPDRGAKRPGITEDGLMEMARSIAKPVEIKLTFSDGPVKDTERSLKRHRTLYCNSITVPMSLERKIIVEIFDAERAGNDDFVAIPRGRLARVRTQLDALFGDS